MRSPTSNLLAKMCVYTHTNTCTQRYTHMHGGDEHAPHQPGRMEDLRSLFQTTSLCARITQKTAQAKNGVGNLQKDMHE